MNYRSGVTKSEIVAIIGIIVFFTGFLFLAVHWIKVQDYAMVYGTVVDTYEVDSFKGPRSLKGYEKKIEYSYNGVQYSDWAMCVLEFVSEGDSIGVYCEQGCPGVIHSRTEMWYAPGILTTIGFFIGFGAMFRSKDYY